MKRALPLLLLSLPLMAWGQDAYRVHLSTVPEHCIVDGIVQTAQPGCVMQGPRRAPVHRRGLTQAEREQQAVEIAAAKAQRQEQLAAYYARLADLKARYAAMAGAGRLGAARAIGDELAELEAQRIRVILGGAVPTVKAEATTVRTPQPRAREAAGVIYKE